MAKEKAEAKTITTDTGLKVKLKKNGDIDKRSLNYAMKHQTVREALDKAKQVKTQEIEEDDDESESEEEEFEIKPLAKKTAPEPVERPPSPIPEAQPEPTPTPAPKPSVDYEEYMRIKQEREELEKEREMLKKRFDFNQHLNRLSRISKQVQLKF